MAVLKIQDISKRFDKHEALKHIDLTFDEGSVIGLIGRNGAGKTTLMNIIASLIMADKGNVILDNTDLVDNSEVLSKLSFAREASPFDEDTRLGSIIKIGAIVYPNWNQKSCDSMMKAFKLNKKMKIKKMSKGMKTMFSLIMTMASEAEILMFDEPTEGLDAFNRKLFYKFIVNIASNQKDQTIIISSHLLSELELLLEEIILLDDGVVVFQKDIDSVKELLVELEGKKDDVIKVIKGKQVFSSFEIGEKSRVVVSRESLLEGDFLMIDDCGITINPVSSQDTCIYYSGVEDNKEEIT